MVIVYLIHKKKLSNQNYITQLSECFPVGREESEKHMIFSLTPKARTIVSFNIKCFFGVHGKIRQLTL